MIFEQAGPISLRNEPVEVFSAWKRALETAVAELSSRLDIALFQKPSDPQRADRNREFDLRAFLDQACAPENPDTLPGRAEPFECSGAGVPHRKASSAGA